VLNIDSKKCLTQKDTNMKNLLKTLSDYFNRDRNARELRQFIAIEYKNVADVEYIASELLRSKRGV